MATSRAGVIGSPIKHSLSPVMHNAAYKHLGLDWEYGAIELDGKDVGTQIRNLFDEGIKGLNVTMPYKEIAFDISFPHGPASRLGTVNTLIKADDGHIHGYSTDGQGFIESLKELSIDVEDARVMVIGAGGAARSICDALEKVRANVFVTARKLESSMKIVQGIVSRRIQSQTESPVIVDLVEYSERNEFIEECDIIVNATPVGMTIDSKSSKEVPIDVEKISPNHLVIDTIYNPVETELLRRCREKGATTVNGIPMLVHQGALAFSIMTGEKAPIEIMKQALEDKLVEVHNK